MMSRRLVIVLMLTLVLIPFVVRAQDAGAGDWTLWLYESGDRTLQQVAPDGQILGTIDLPFVENRHASGFAMALSPDASHIGYTLADTLSAFEAQGEVVIADLQTNAMTNRYPLHEGSDVNSVNQATAGLRADPTNDNFAFGYGFFTGDGNDVDWEVVLLPAIGSATVLTRANFSAAGFEPEPYTYPFVTGVQDGVVTFAILSIEGPTDTASRYVWDTTSSTITDLGIGRLPFDTTPDGDQLFAELDESLPFGEIIPRFGPQTQRNTVYLVNADGSDRQLVFHTPDESILRTFFVEDGQRIGVFTATPSEDLKLTIVDRDGIMVSEQTGLSSTPDLYDTPDGYLYFDRPANQEPVLKHVTTVDESMAERELLTGGLTSQYDLEVRPAA